MVYDLRGKPYIKKSLELDTDSLPLETCIDENNEDEPIAIDEENSNDKNVKKRSKARIIRSVWYNKEKDPEKHYRELIMLFTSWRNEDTDLIGNCSSYQEHFLLVKETIDEQMKQYAVCIEDLNAVQEHLNNEEENNNFDLIASTTEDIERQDEAEGDHDLHPDFNEEYDLADDVGGWRVVRGPGGVHWGHQVHFVNAGKCPPCHRLCHQVDCRMSSS